MSSVIRPSGPLPPRVYWVRRVLLLAFVVLVVSAVWWLLSGLGNPHSGGGATPQAAVTPDTVTPPAPTTSAGATGGGRADAHRHRSHHAGNGPGRRHSPRAALPPPTGPCSPTDVAIAVQVAGVRQGEATTSTLSLTSRWAPACTLTVSPHSMVVRIVSKNGLLVWTSDDCPNAVPARQLVVRSERATIYRMPWDGHRSVEGCSSPGPPAAPGDYWFEVALLGADVYRGEFTIADESQ
jgi:hypothetical protein